LTISHYHYELEKKFALEEVTIDELKDEDAEWSDE